MNNGPAESDGPRQRTPALLPGGVEHVGLGASNERAGPPREEDGWLCLDPLAHSSISNFDHSIEVGTEERLKAGRVFASHAAWDFHGRVWWDGEQFREEIWVHGGPVEILISPTLEELMELANTQYGSE